MRWYDPIFEFNIKKKKLIQWLLFFFTNNFNWAYSFYFFLVLFFSFFLNSCNIARGILLVGLCACLFHFFLSKCTCNILKLTFTALWISKRELYKTGFFNLDDLSIEMFVDFLGLHEWTMDIGTVICNKDHWLFM